MNVTVKNHNGEVVALVAVGALAYLWWKGSETVPDAPTGSTSSALIQNSFTKVKAGWEATLSEWMPATTTTAAALPPVSTAATPVIAQQSCLNGVRGIGSILTTDGVYTPAKDVDAGTQAIRINTTNVVPISPRQIAAAAVTAKPC